MAKSKSSASTLFVCSFVVFDCVVIGFASKVGEVKAAVAPDPKLLPTGPGDVADDDGDVPPPPPPPVAKKNPTATALFMFPGGHRAGDVAFAANEKLEILQPDSKGWMKGVNSKGQTGFFPSSYVKLD